MRGLPLTILLILSLGAFSACGSTVTQGPGGSHGGGSSGAGHGGGSSSGAGMCVQQGDYCNDPPTCCSGLQCSYAMCCPLINQCMCNGVAVGPPTGCHPGEACGLDGGLDTGIPDGGEGCVCKQVYECG